MWKQGSIPVAVKGRRSGDGGRGRRGRGRRRPTCRPLCLPALRHESLQQQLQRVGAAAPHRHAGPAEQLLLAGEDGASGDRGRDRLQVSESGSLGRRTTAAPKSEQALKARSPGASSDAYQVTRVSIGVVCTAAAARLLLDFAPFLECLRTGRGVGFSSSLSHLGVLGGVNKRARTSKAVKLVSLVLV